VGPGGALEDPDRLAAPLHDHAHAGFVLDLADIDVDRGAGILRARARLPGSDERDRCRADTDRADDGGGGGQEASASRVDFIVGHSALRSCK